MNSQQNAELDVLWQMQNAEDQYLTFELCAERYGVDILRVQEIRGWEAVTPLPNTPKFVKGVTNLRGAIVPIVDLRAYFSLPEVEFGPMTVVIILKVHHEKNEKVMGIVVDAVSDVCHVTHEELQSAPEISDKKSLSFIKGLASVDEQIVVMLDVDKMLAIKQLIEE